jgi:hypothetical protein
MIASGMGRARRGGWCGSTSATTAITGGDRLLELVSPFPRCARRRRADRNRAPGLTPEVIRAAVKRAVETVKARPAINADRPAKLLRDNLAQLDRKSKRLVAAISETEGPLARRVLEKGLEECELEPARLRAALAKAEGAATRTMPRLDEVGEKRIGRDFEARLRRWRDLLVADPQTAREALRALMPAERPIQFVPEKDGYLLRGETRLGALLFDAAAAPAITSARLASPRGFEPRFSP